MLRLNRKSRARHVDVRKCASIILGEPTVYHGSMTHCHRCQVLYIIICLFTQVLSDLKWIHLEIGIKFHIYILLTAGQRRFFFQNLQFLSVIAVKAVIGGVIRSVSFFDLLFKNGWFLVSISDDGTI